MPRPSAVSKQQAIDIVKKYIEHFSTNSFPKYTDKVWKDMSDDLEGMWNAHSVYINVRENRRQILSIARSDLGIVIEEPTLLEELNPLMLCDVEVKDAFIEKNLEKEEKLIPLQNNNSNDCDNSNDYFPNNESVLSQDEDQNEHETFDLIITKEEWNLIKPSNTVIYGKRKRKILKPSVWTNVISLAFWRQFGMPCVFSFKRADVYLSSDELQYSVKVIGICKDRECSNIFMGEAIVGVNNEGFIMIVHTRDTRHMKHTEVKHPFARKKKKKKICKKYL